jgi:hypothetical protein
MTTISSDGPVASSMGGTTMTATRVWIVHSPHGLTSWANNLRQELVSAFRRGTMDAARCLSTYRLHGERSVLPPEAVIYLATRVVAGDSCDVPSWDRYDGRQTSEFLAAQGERELALLIAAGVDCFDDWVEAGRRFFFPGPLGRG